MWVFGCYSIAAVLFALCACLQVKSDQPWCVAMLSMLASAANILAAIIAAGAIQ